MIQFADAENGLNIPPGFQFAALYSADCDHPTPETVASRWSPAKRRWITFRGAEDCSIIDYEPLTRDYQQPALLRGWLEQRLDDRDARVSWIYSDLDNAATAARHALGLPFQWWVATLDNVRRSPAQLQDLLIAWGVPAHQAQLHMIAAHQWQSAGTYDGSVCFVDRDW